MVNAFIVLVYSLALLGSISLIGFPYLFYRVIKDIQFVKSTQFLANHRKFQPIKNGMIAGYIFILLASVFAYCHYGFKLAKCWLGYHCHASADGVLIFLASLGVVFVSVGIIYSLLKLVLNFLSKK